MITPAIKIIKVFGMTPWKKPVKARRLFNG